MIRRFPGQKIGELSLDPNGKRVAITSDNGKAWLWAAGSREAAVLEGGAWPVFTDCGRMLVGNCHDGGLRIWLPAVSRTPLVSVYSLAVGGWVALAPDGRWDGAGPEAGLAVAWVRGLTPLPASEAPPRHPGLVPALLHRSLRRGGTGARQ